MATDVILPALGMSQDTGKIVRWLKAEGEHVAKGEPLVEIETDKATVEIEAPAEGVLARVSSAAGDDVPVGQVIAAIVSAHEASPTPGRDPVHGVRDDRPPGRDLVHGVRDGSTTPVQGRDPVHGVRDTRPVSALAARVAADHNIDLGQVKTSGTRIQKADVLAYLQNQENSNVVINGAIPTSTATLPRLAKASPKARRLANEQGKDLLTIKGSGPDGAVLAADVLASAINAGATNLAPTDAFIPHIEEPAALTNGASDPGMSTIWRIMAERTTQSWAGTPHFYLTREVNVSRLINWREHIVGTTPTSPVKITYTDLLVKIIATALRMHPRLNASWRVNKVVLNSEIHVGLAVAIEDGLVVPVIQSADTLTVSEIAQQRADLVTKAQTGKLRPQDISGGTFTISNLGMYNVDAFNAIINQPQAAILAIGRISERVVPMHGQPAIQPMMVLTLSCDHRAVDGARGARFLESVANFIEEPLGLLV